MKQALTKNWSHVRKQALIFVGMALATAALAIFWLFGSEALPLQAPTEDDPASRLAFAARWMLIPGFALIVGIGVTAAFRFFLRDGIDGSRTPETRVIEISLRYNQNTLEQTVLAAIAWTCLSLELPHDRLAIIPALSMLFGVARALFWLGYLISPSGRALGFALTFYPTVAAFIWLAARWSS